MENEQPAWKPALDAITGARHGGQIEGVLGQLTSLAQAHPHVAAITYQLAWTLDSLGNDAEALPHYEIVIALGLPPNGQSGALIGLGPTLRNLGELDRAAEVLESGALQFPDQPEFEAFLALVRHDQGRKTEALQIAMRTLLDSSDDPGITAYQRALRYYISALE